MGKFMGKSTIAPLKGQSVTRWKNHVNKCWQPPLLQPNASIKEHQQKVTCPTCTEGDKLLLVPGGGDPDLFPGVMGGKEQPLLSLCFCVSIHYFTLKPLCSYFHVMEKSRSHYVG